MAEEPVWPVRHLLDKLEDPFIMFPLEGVANALYEAVNEADTQKIECTSPLDPEARKFWSVEKEYHHEKIGLLVGALFVLGQAVITQTESVLNSYENCRSGRARFQMRKTASLSNMPRQRTKPTSARWLLSMPSAITLSIGMRGRRTGALQRTIVPKRKPTQSRSY